MARLDFLLIVANLVKLEIEESIQIIKSCLCLEFFLFGFWGGFFICLVGFCCCYTGFS